MTKARKREAKRRHSKAKENSKHLQEREARLEEKAEHGLSEMTKKEIGKTKLLTEACE